MILPWLKNHYRHELLAATFPEAWLSYLQANVAYYRLLPPDAQRRLQGIARVILAEKGWEGCGGLTLTDEIQVTVAAQAAVLVLGFAEDYYPNVETILVYPQSFLVPDRRQQEGRVITERRAHLSGEAALRGPVVLSWADALSGGRELGSGYNVVWHEFAHKLDMRDGAADGAPYLRDGAQIETWARVMSAEYYGLVAATQAGEPTLLRSYGATNAAEFFAVATECFFGQSGLMARERPALYAVLRDFYRQDPAALWAAHGVQWPHE